MIDDKAYRPPPLPRLPPRPLRDERGGFGPGSDFAGMAGMLVMGALGFCGLLLTGGNAGMIAGMCLGGFIDLIILAALKEDGFFERVRDDPPEWLKVTNNVLQAFYALASLYLYFRSGR